MNDYKQTLAKLSTIKRKIKYVKCSGQLNPEKFEQMKSNLVVQINQVEEKVNDDILNADYTEKTENYKALIESLRDKFTDITIPKNSNDIKELYVRLNSILSEIEKIKILRVVSEIENTIVIVGANGAGKSSFVSELKKTTLPNLCVLPAHK